MTQPIRYSDLVNYDVMDAVKRLMQKAAESTHANVSGAAMVSEAKGGSVSLFFDGFNYQGVILEQLGTKNLIAEAMRKLDGKSYFRSTAKDTAATIFNDSSTAGLRPQMGAMFIAAGSESWFKDKECIEDYALGWQEAFDEAKCIWGGGEMGTLGGIVLEHTAVLAGAVMGKVSHKNVLLPTKLIAGMRIVLLASNGPHANGISSLRKLAGDKGRMPEGYLTKLPNGETFGEAILKPTPLYGKVIETCQSQVHPPSIAWAVNISGHAYRKLMRAPHPLRYVIESLPPSQPIFDFMKERLEVDDREMLGNYNCGGGYALFVPPESVKQVIQISEGLGIPAFDSGHIESSDQREVVIEEKGITWGPKDLDL